MSTELSSRYLLMASLHLHPARQAADLSAHSACSGAGCGRAPRIRRLPASRSRRPPAPTHPVRTSADAPHLVRAALLESRREALPAPRSTWRPPLVLLVAIPRHVPAHAAIARSSSSPLPHGRSLPGSIPFAAPTNLPATRPPRYHQRSIMDATRHAPLKGGRPVCRCPSCPTSSTACPASASACVTTAPCAASPSSSLPPPLASPPSPCATSKMASAPRPPKPSSSHSPMRSSLARTSVRP